MNILLVSQCRKNALTQTRRILDQFAERSGDATWQTHITQQGLKTLKKLLQRTARRNTAVACHWFRARNHVELLWIVGRANAFNEKGRVPTNTTERNILLKGYENNWQTLTDIQILAVIAGLFHDFGKSCIGFQNKLKNNQRISDAYRHEWISLRLFAAFVANAADDKTWLTKMASLMSADKQQVVKECLTKLFKDGIDRTTNEANPFSQQENKVFEQLPPLAKIVGWLVLSHHFLPNNSNTSTEHNKLDDVLEQITPAWNDATSEATNEQKQRCWQFDNRLPFISTKWCLRASRWAKRALDRQSLFVQDKNWLSDTYSLHLARLSIMLADHYYSSLAANPRIGDKNFPLYANTDHEGRLKQRLDEHLIGVSHAAKNIVRNLPYLEKILPRIAAHKGFRRRSQDARFRWQDRAYDLAYHLREQTEQYGFFGVNMASTGCGKTLANGRIMYALANPKLGARFNIALGLRTLTLQTGKAYRDRLKLDDDALGVFVGSSAVQDLFESHQAQQKPKADKNDQQLSIGIGSESAQPLMDDNTYIDYEGTMIDGPIKRWLAKNHQAAKLLSTPILVCTVDHLIGATEGVRGGKQITPMLRLLTSDLILDEPDDFDLADLPALTRLVNWAGMLGSRVLLSSATLPPALITGLFNAYCGGRAKFQQSRGEFQCPLNVTCAWFDEFNTQTSHHQNETSFEEQHQAFVEKRVQQLKNLEIRRRADIVSIADAKKLTKPLDIRECFANYVQKYIHALHDQHHTVDPKTNKKFSFGLVRFAHIDPLIDITKSLLALGAKENYFIKFCCYHSHHPLIIRSNLEEQLDQLLNRHDSKSILKNTFFRQTLDNCEQQHVIFLVLASPVAEVGRDHDYDWAIIEPSSMRSIIQLAGRVRRHRAGICQRANIYLLNTNLKSLEKPNALSYMKPGFEGWEGDRKFKLSSKYLNDILVPEDYEVIRATPRIQARTQLNSEKLLVDLEHARLQALMLDSQQNNFPVHFWWDHDSRIHLTGILQKEQRFRKSQPQKKYCLFFEEQGDQPKFHELEQGKPPLDQDHCFHRVDDLHYGKNIKPWQLEKYETAIGKMAQSNGMSLYQACMRYGALDLQEDQEWWYHPVLGLRRKN